MCWLLLCVFTSLGNILNFNVGTSVDLDVPRSFWSRLAGKYGNMFYWKEKVSLCNLNGFACFHRIIGIGI